MALVFKGLVNIYKSVFDDYLDPHNPDDFRKSHTFLFTFLTTYLLFVKLIGPAMMRNREPFNIKKILIVYNSLQIIFNSYIFYECIVVFLASPSLICVNTSRRDIFRDIERHYIYLKILDCAETVFFVLRKSYRQISLLHVYHHTVILFGAWCGNKYYWGDSVMMIPLLNSFVHAIMFVYYLLTSLDPKWKKNIAMKRNVTLIQIVQLNMMWMYFLATMLIPNCEGRVHPYAAYLWIINNFYMVTLFIKFYLRNYVNFTKKRN